MGNHPTTPVHPAAVAAAAASGNNPNSTYNLLHPTAGRYNVIGAGIVWDNTDHHTWDDPALFYSRGAPSCPPGKAEWNGLCYDECKPGYFMSSQGICTQTCPPGYSYNGSGCTFDSKWTIAVGPENGAQHQYSDVPRGRVCAPGQEEQDGLCYEPCPAGMVGKGPVCWDKGGLSYGNTAGAPLHTCPSGMERDGALCYPKCKAGYHGVGPVCWQDCPPNTTDSGVACTKHSYGRGVGTIPSTCKTGYQLQGALCYPDCKPGFKGVGPMCWKEVGGKSSSSSSTEAQPKESSFF